MRPKAKTLAYARRMITSGKWKDKVPPASRISDSVGVSAQTVRLALKVLEEQRVLENNGSLGYGVIPPKMGELYKANKQLYYLAMLQRNARIAEMLDQGGRILGNFVFVTKPKKEIDVANLSTGEITNTNLSEIVTLLRRPMTVEQMLKLDGKPLRTAKLQYLKQQRLHSVPEMILHHRKELGL